MRGREGCRLSRSLKIPLNPRPWRWVNAAGVEGVALTHPPSRVQDPLPRPDVPKASNGVMRARRRESTMPPEQPRQRDLVAPHETDEQPRDERNVLRWCFRHGIRRGGPRRPEGAAGRYVRRGMVVAHGNARRESTSRALRCNSGRTPAHSARTPARVSIGDPSRAMTRRSTPAGSSGGSSLNASRTSRRTRLRRTESPTLRVTVTPSREGADAEGPAATSSVKWGV